LPADCIVLDLEDSVAPDLKPAARAQACAAVTAGGFGPREVVVRINSLDTSWWRDDIAAATAAKPDAILVPKVSSPRHPEGIAERLAGLAADRRIQIWAMMETPLAVLNAGAIAAATDGRTRLSAFVMGTNDLAKDTRVRVAPGREALRSWLMTCVAAARAYG